MVILYYWLLFFMLIAILALNDARKKNKFLLEAQERTAQKYEGLSMQWEREYYLLKSSDAIKEGFDINLSFESFGNNKAIRRVPNE